MSNDNAVIQNEVDSGGIADMGRPAWTFGGQASPAITRGMVVAAVGRGCLGVVDALHPMAPPRTDDYPTRIRHPITGLVNDLGGSETVNRKASSSARAEALAFLRRYLETELSR